MNTNKVIYVGTPLKKRINKVIIIIIIITIIIIIIIIIKLGCCAPFEAGFDTFF